MKDLKYEKRKRLSNTPERHLGPSPPRRPPLQHQVHDLSPYPAERYPSSSAIVHSSQFSSPTRKKTRREPERYFASRSMSASPPRRHAVDPLHSEPHISRRPENAGPVLHHKPRHIPLGHADREKHGYDIRNKHESSAIMPRNHSKDPLKVPYPSENSRYRSASPGDRYIPGGPKSYGPTLHERFSSVIESNRTEPRIRYSRADLEKITIDIKRNVREPSPVPRHIINSADVKLVRRGNEGPIRPIFDREEIKQVPRDLRGDAYYDRKAGSYGSAHPVDLRPVENYQITRHRFEPPMVPASSGRSLSDRWQNHEVRKETPSLDRDEREKEYRKVPVSRNYIDVRSRSRSGDRDFRSERYLDSKPSSRSDYPIRPPPPMHASAESSIPYSHRKSTVPVDARHKLNIRRGGREGHSTAVRSDIKDHYLATDRHYPEPIPPRVERREYPSPLPEPHKWDYKNRSPSREKFSDFGRRPDKYTYRSSDVPPKSTHYLESEGRDGSSSFRGSSRPFRSPRGFRGRGFRGPSRGSTFYRGSFRGSYRSSSSPRGRGIPRR